MAKHFSHKAILEKTKGFLGLAKPSKKRIQIEGPIETKQEAPLLNLLPVEIRLQIYDLLLGPPFCQHVQDWWSAVQTRHAETWIRVDFMRTRPPGRLPTKCPGILLTCKQVYLEAIPTLYSREIFSFDDPIEMLWFMDHIGPTNTKLIRYLHMGVPPVDKASWLKLLRVLPTVATGLKRVEVRWMDSTLFDDCDLGRDVAFAQAVAGLSKVNLEKLRIEGYYAKPWPAYFRDKFGVRVVESQEEDSDPIWRIEIYQAETEWLNPWKGEAA